MNNAPGFMIPIPLRKIPSVTQQGNMIYGTMNWDLLTGKVTAMIEFQGMLCLAELKLVAKPETKTPTPLR